MRLVPRALTCLTTACLWLCSASFVQAQSWSATPDFEPSAGRIWQERSLEEQLQESDADTAYLPPISVPELRRDRSPEMASMMGGPTNGMGGPGGRSPFSMYGFFQPASTLQNQPGTFQVRGEGLSLGLPVSMGPDGIWILNTRVEHNSFDTDALLPGTRTAFPDELWNINLGLMHIHPLENGWTLGGMVGIGSASDQPFASIREMNANVLAFLRIPASDRDAWNFSLFYSPMGQLAFPIPGIAYAWNPNDQFQMSIGLPFSLTYRPYEELSLNISYLPLTNASAIVRWTPNENWTIYGGYQTYSQGYELADRADSRERLFQFDQRLMLGLRRKLVGNFVLDCSAAYLFDRSYFLSDSFFGDNRQELRIDPGAQLMLRLEWVR